MKIYTRQEIIDLYPRTSPDVMFIPETGLPSGTSLQYFIFVEHFKWPSSTNVSDFWLWCSTSLTGYTRCISSSDDEELWGFSDQRDINFFLLRWT